MGWGTTADGSVQSGCIGNGKLHANTQYAILYFWETLCTQLAKSKLDSLGVGKHFGFLQNTLHSCRQPLVP